LMTTIEFPYCRSTPKGKQVCNCDDPYVTITLSNAGFEVTVEGLVDSGCTMTLVNCDFAEALGVDLSTCTETSVTGVGAIAKGYMTTVDFQVQGFNNSFSSPVIFVENLPVPTLLGQLNFFQHFNVHFQKKNHKLILED